MMHHTTGLNRPFTMIILVGLGLTLASSAWGRPPRLDHRPPVEEAFPERLLENAGVAPETREKIAALSRGSADKARQLHEQIFAARQTMRNLLEQDSPDPERVMQQVQSIGNLEIDADKHRLATMLSIRSLLTPEQRAELTQLHQVHHKRKSGHGMRQIERACRDTLDAACSDLIEVHERLNCLEHNDHEISESCKLAMDRVQRPRHPRFQPPADAPTSSPSGGITGAD